MDNKGFRVKEDDFLEIMEFTILDNHFGINVAKVVELIQIKPIIPMPNSNQFIEGIFSHRGSVLTVVNLAAYLGIPMAFDKVRHDILIITSFNQINVAFHVGEVLGMVRLKWLDIEKPSSAIYGGESGLATGLGKLDDRVITIIDFEKLMADISPSSSIDVTEIAELGERERNSWPILIAEDSVFLAKLIHDAIEKAGYTNIIMCENGKVAWETLMSYAETGLPLGDQIKCLITDIEMPQMDGHTLLKKIREDSFTSQLPVIIFSSHIIDDVKAKGDRLGATAQVTKPEIGKLVSIMDTCIANASGFGSELVRAGSL